MFIYLFVWVVRMSVGERLKTERLRLGYTQKEFGELGGVKLNSQAKYERGETSPNTNYLENIGREGADVFYILTGERTQEAEPENFEQHLEQCVDMLFEVQQETGISFDKDTYKNALGFAFTTKATKSQMIKFVKAIVDAHSP